MKCAKRRLDYSQMFETLFWHTLYGVAIWAWYRLFLFRCFAKLSLVDSRVLLLCIVFICASLGFIIDRHILKDDVHALFNLLVGFGIYTAMTYIKIKPLFIILSISLSVVAVIVYALWIVCRKVPNIDNMDIFKSVRNYLAIKRIKSIVCTCMTIIIAVIGISVILGGFIVKPSVYASKATDSQEWTVNNKIEELVLFFDEERWEKAKITTKLNTCQVLANICQTKWGINELNVVSSNTSDIIAGYYDDKEHLILINVDYLMTATGPDVCNTVIHEAYHALEHRMVDAYLAAPEDMKNLELYQEAAVYKQEFDNYHNCNDADFFAYSNQLCEKNARFWADYTTYKIRYAVKEYYEGQNG